MKILFTNILLLCFLLAPAQKKSPLSNTWKETLKNKKGNLVIYWYPSTPFIFENERGEVAGVEYEILEGFKKFISDRYQIELTLQWKKSEGFLGTFNDVKNSHEPVLGSSAFSILPERAKVIDFTPAYLGDVSVLISSSDVPMATSD